MTQSPSTPDGGPASGRSSAPPDIALAARHDALRREILTELFQRAAVSDQQGGDGRRYLLIDHDDLRRGVAWAIHDWAARRTPASETLPCLADHLLRCRAHVAALREAGHTSLAHDWQRLLDDLLHLVGTGRSLTPLARAVEDLELGRPASDGGPASGRSSLSPDGGPASGRSFDALVAAEFSRALTLHQLARLGDAPSRLRDRGTVDEVTAAAAAASRGSA